MYKVYIIEDDRSLANEMKKNIEAWDNKVILASDFQNIMVESQRLNPTLFWLILTCHFSMAITGAVRLERYLMCQ